MSLYLKIRSQMDAGLQTHDGLIMDLVRCGVWLPLLLDFDIDARRSIEMVTRTELLIFSVQLTDGPARRMLEF